MKNYEVVMIVECEEGAQNHIAQSVCDGLEEPYCVKFIKIKHISKDDTIKRGFVKK